MNIKTWQERMIYESFYSAEGRLFAGRTAVTMARDAEVVELRKYIAELEATRMAYASEFEYDLDENGMPNVGNIHQNIRKLKQAYVIAVVNAERYEYIRDVGNQEAPKIVAEFSGDDLDSAIDEDMNK